VSERLPSVNERTNKLTRGGDRGGRRRRRKRRTETRYRTWTRRGIRGTRHEEARERNGGSDILVIVVVV